MEAALHSKTPKNTWIRVVVAEGRQHLVKRLMEAAGAPVVKLFRADYGGIDVQGLMPGELRELKRDEVELLRAQAGKKAEADKKPRPVSSCRRGATDTGRPSPSEGGRSQTMARTRQLLRWSDRRAGAQRLCLALAPLRVPQVRRRVPLALLLGLLACGPNQRTLALQQLHADSPRERAAAARKLGQLGKPEDDELWVALERLTRDRVASVRIAAAESLAGAPKSDMREPDQRGALADDGSRRS